MKYATTRSDALDTYIFNDKDNLNSEAYGVVIAVPPGPHRKETTGRESGKGWQNGSPQDRIRIKNSNDIPETNTGKAIQYRTK